MARKAIPNFELANPIYRGATVTFWTVVGGVKTNVRATLYAAGTGSTQLANPQKLDSRGKFRQAVYIEAPVIGTIEGLSVATHDTGVIAPAPTFRINSTTAEVEISYDGGLSWTGSGEFFFRKRGAWAGPGTTYERSDLVQESGKTYIALVDHTSAALFATDLGAGKWLLLLDLTALGVTAFAMTLLDDANANAARVTLGFPAITAKGSLITATAANTLSELVAAANGRFLMTDSADARGIRYEIPPMGGRTLYGGRVLVQGGPGVGNVLTVTVVGTPFYLKTRNFVAGTSSEHFVEVTASPTLSIAGTMGVVANEPFRIWIVGFLEDGTDFRLAAIKCTIGTAPNVSIYPLGAFGIADATLAGAGSNSSGVFYADNACTADPYTVLAYATWESGLGVPGTWTSPSRIQQFASDVRLPGSIVQLIREQTGAVATGTTQIPTDDTIPQVTEGDEYIDVSITPSSAANLLRARSYLSGSNNQATSVFGAAIFKDADANALVASPGSKESAANAFGENALEHVMVAGQTTALTFNLRAGTGVAGTTTINGSAAARTYGGAQGSFLEASEIQT